MPLRKGATFHCPSSTTADNQLQLPSLPRRSQTSLEDVVEAHKRRVALTLGDIDRGLSNVDLNSDSQERQSFRDDASPVPQGFLNPSATPHCPAAHKGIMSDILTAEPVDYTVGGRSLRPRRSIRRPQVYDPSDSGIGSSIHSSASGKRSISTAMTSMASNQGVKSVLGTSAITRSVAADPSTIAGLPHMSQRARNRIQEHILNPLLARSAFKDFHPILKDCPRRIDAKEIVCLRDLEKTLILQAPVSDIRKGDVVEWLAYCFSHVQEKSRSAKLYRDFCLVSIQCIQATVQYLNEREQIRATDRPYTSGYFVDLVEQIRSYARQVQATKEKEEKGDAIDEMDAKSYVFYSDLSLLSSHRVQHSTSPLVSHAGRALIVEDCSRLDVKPHNTNHASCRTDEVKLYGGITRNGRPAELVHIKNGKAFSIATGQPIKMESIEEDENGGRQVTKLEDAEDNESILRSMARRKRSASAAELAPKCCSEPGCNKEFKRSCDLTKHQKTHSRPFKCNEPGCKYHEFGWPTEKELERHVNDKHSLEPVLYHCKFPPCPYKSKRESNCKQHMEKSHQWTYIKSKNNGKKNKDSTLPTPQTMDHPTPESEIVYTPEDDYDMREDRFMTGNYFDNSAFPEHTFAYPYPQEVPHDMPMEGLSYVSPAGSGFPHSTGSPEAALPPLDDNGFHINNITMNFGQGFESHDEDIYNATAQVQFPTPPNHVYDHKLGLNPVMSYNQMKEEHVPHISPTGQGNAMLYTPTSLGTHESFEYDANELQQGMDFPLFPTTTGNNLQNNALFGEVPSMGFNTLSQSSAQLYFQDFYNSASVDWPMSQNEGLPRF
jgi:hypothetical protein